VPALLWRKSPPHVDPWKEDRARLGRIALMRSAR
jgi:hypothetical protein